MKILIIRPHASFLNRKNYNTQEEGLAKALIRRGNVCDIVYYSGESVNRVETVKFLPNLEYNVYWTSGKKIGNFAVFNKEYLNDLIANYDIIQTLEYEQLYSWLLFRRFPLKVVLYHGPYYAKYNKKYRAMSHLFDLLYSKSMKHNMYAICKSKRASEYLHNKGIKHTKCIPVGLDISNLNYGGKVSKSKTKNLIYVGVLEPRRNIIFLLQVMRKLITTEENTRLILIGDGEKNYVKKCKDFVSTHHLEEYVEFAGKKEQSEISDYYNKSIALLLASSYEIFGMVIMEAMLFNCVVISTPNGGSDTLIENRKTGYIVDAFEVDRWIETIKYILHKNQDEIIRNARLNIINNFTWDKLAEKFENAYQCKMEGKYINDID